MKLNPFVIYPLLRKIRKRMQELCKENGNPYEAKNLAGWCILTSYVLYHILKRKGYKPEVCKNGGHAFIVCDGWYIDLTATQFNSDWREKQGIRFPPVFIKREGDKEIHEITGRTSEDSEIWGSLCRGWNKPMDPEDSHILKMITEF